MAYKRKIYIGDKLQCFMKIYSKEAGLCIKSSFPKFKYRFPEADKAVEVEDDHVEKVLRNPTFYKATNKNLNSQKAKK